MNFVFLFTIIKTVWKFMLKSNKCKPYKSSYILCLYNSYPNRDCLIIKYLCSPPFKRKCVVSTLPLIKWFHFSENNVLKLFINRISCFDIKWQSQVYSRNLSVPFQRFNFWKLYWFILIYKNYEEQFQRLHTWTFII